MSPQQRASDHRRILHPYLCLPCRTSFKRNVIWDAAPDALPCPHCGQPAVWMSRKFKPPRRAANAQWQKVEALVLAGSRFASTVTYAPFPKHVRDVPDFVRTHYANPRSTIGLPQEKPRRRQTRWRSA